MLNLFVPYSDLYWLAESPCAELQFLKLTDFFYTSPSILEACLHDWKEETPFSSRIAAVPCLWFETPTIDKCRQGLYEKSGQLLPVQ